MFILYCKDTTLIASHDISGDQLCKDALALADFLMYCGGIDCSIDQYENESQHNWNLWTQRKIKESKHVILIVSPLLNEHLLNGKHTDVHMKNGPFYSDGITNMIYAPKFVPVFLNKCVPLSGNFADWLQFGLRMCSYFHLQGLAQFVAEMSESEEDFFQQMTRRLAEDRYQELARLVRFLRGEQGVAKPDPPFNPVPIPSLQCAPSPHGYQSTQGKSVHKYYQRPICSFTCNDQNT